MSFFKALGIGSNKNQNAKKGKDASRGDYKKGNSRDKSKSHTISNPGRSGGNNKPGGRR